MSSKEWSKYSQEEIRVCLLELSDNFLKYRGSAFSKNECKSVSDLVLYYAGMADKWLEISGYQNNILSRKFLKIQPVGNIKINLEKNAGVWVFMKSVLPALVSGNTVTVSGMLLNKKKAVELSAILNLSGIPAGTINIKGELNILSLKGNPEDSPADIQKYTITKEILY